MLHAIGWFISLLPVLPLFLSLLQPGCFALGSSPAYCCASELLADLTAYEALVNVTLAELQYNNTILYELYANASVQITSFNTDLLNLNNASSALTAGIHSLNQTQQTMDAKLLSANASTNELLWLVANMSNSYSLLSNIQTVDGQFLSQINSMNLSIAWLNKTVVALGMEVGDYFSTFNGSYTILNDVYTLLNVSSTALAADTTLHGQILANHTADIAALQSLASSLDNALFLLNKSVNALQNFTVSISVAGNVSVNLTQLQRDIGAGSDMVQAALANRSILASGIRSEIAARTAQVQWLNNTLLALSSFIAAVQVNQTGMQDRLSLLNLTQVSRLSRTDLSTVVGPIEYQILDVYPTMTVIVPSDLAAAHQLQQVLMRSTAQILSVVAGVLAFFVFGVAYFLLETALPAAVAGSVSYSQRMAGFILMKNVLSGILCFFTVYVAGAAIAVQGYGASSYLEQSGLMGLLPTEAPLWCVPALAALSFWAVMAVQAALAHRLHMVPALCLAVALPLLVCLGAGFVWSLPASGAASFANIYFVDLGAGFVHVLAGTFALLGAVYVDARLHFRHATRSAASALSAAAGAGKGTIRKKQIMVNSVEDNRFNDPHNNQTTTAFFLIFFGGVLVVMSCAYIAGTSQIQLSSVLNVLLAGSASFCLSFCRRHLSTEGLLPGLVAVSLVAGSVPGFIALLLGLAGALSSEVAMYGMRRLRLDDAADTVALHLAPALVGLLSSVLLVLSRTWFHSLSPFVSMPNQLLLAVVVCVASLLSAFIFWRMLLAALPSLRIPIEWEQFASIDKLVSRKLNYFEFAPRVAVQPHLHSLGPAGRDSPKTEEWSEVSSVRSFAFSARTRTTATGSADRSSLYSAGTSISQRGTLTGGGGGMHRDLSLLSVGIAKPGSIRSKQHKTSSVLSGTEDLNQ